MSDRYPQWSGITSVTEVIKAEGLMGDMSFIDPWYMERGKAIHEATAYYDKGTLDDSTVDPRIQGYLEAWKKFRADTGYVPEFIEKSLQHPIYKYCGTLDRDGLDIKSGSPAPWHVIQGAAYYRLQVDNNKALPIMWRTIYLQEDGSYKVHNYSIQELREGFKIFASALAIHNWKTLKGVK